ncbi:MAG: DHA1 family quinolone resistance protein-like MFS transporter [Oceanospirillaceae bacterium]|jgi:DHA1 family quinolone resistance protein-like MFS transporter
MPASGEYSNKESSVDKTKLLWVYAGHQGLHWAIAGIAIPVLVLIFQSRGLNLQEIGFVMAVWVGSTAALEIPLGSVADKYGRKNTYLFSLIVNTLGCVALYFATDLSLLLVAAFLLGGARAIYSGTLDAWFYDSFHKTEGELTYHQAISKVNVMVTVGLALGSILGGWLPDYVVNSSLNIGSIYDLNIIIIGFANMFLFVVTLIVIHEQKTQRHELPENESKSIIHHSIAVIRESFTHDVLKRLMQTTLVYGLVLSSVETFWQPYLSEIISNSGYGVAVFGVISALYFLMSGASSLLSVQLLRMFGGSHKMLMFATRALSGLAFIALAFTDNIHSFAMCYLTFFFLFTVGNNSERVLLNDNTNESYRSTMLSVSSFVVTSGAVVASLLLGYISEQYGITINWIMCGVLLITTSVLFVFIPEKKEAAEA